jgi:Thymidylate synthase complementing protein
MLTELRKVIPSFLTRVDRPERGGAWSAYLESTRVAMEDLAGDLFAGDEPEPRPAVTLVDFDPEGEDKLLAAMLYAYVDLPEDQVQARVRRLSADERAHLARTYAGDRQNRRHKPGRALERLSYRFDILSDYGAFRDLQRHRLLTIQWQTLGPYLGAGVPAELEDAGVADAYRAGLERSREEHARLVEAGRPEIGPYALCLGYRIRYVLDMNAREAMHVVELRSGREGHPAYRAVAHAIHAEIARVHPAVARAMTHVDADTEPRLERILSEIRTHAKHAARA